MTFKEIRALIVSGCDTAGHCEHKPCCYCVEADRVANEALQTMKLGVK